MGVTRQAARKLAQGMVERGYASFSADPADARRTLVILTKSGRSYARAVASAQDALNDTVRRRVNDAHLAIADGVLRAVFSDEARRRVDANVPPPDRVDGGDQDTAIGGPPISRVTNLSRKDT